VVAAPEVAELVVALTAPEPPKMTPPAGADRSGPRDGRRGPRVGGK